MKQTTGVILVIAGVVFVIGAVKGTWKDIFDAALGKCQCGGGSSATPNADNGGPARSGPTPGQTAPGGVATVGGQTASAFTPGQLGLTSQFNSLVLQPLNGGYGGA